MIASNVILPTDEAAVVATIDPDAYTASTVVSDYVDMRKFRAIQAIVMAGALGTNATLDAKLVEATDASGTGAQDITGKSITQLTEAGTDSDKQAIINLHSEELDIADGYCFVALSMTVGTATSDAGGIIIGHAPVTIPASSNDLSTVDEIVN